MPRCEACWVRASDPRALDGHVRDAVETEIIRVVEEAPAGAGQIDQEIRVQHALRADCGSTNKRHIAADKGGRGIFGRKRELEFRSKILPDANAGLPCCEK